MKKLFFERAQENRGEIPKVFVYDDIPEVVRRQLVLIWSSVSHLQYQAEGIVHKIRESIGEHSLARTSGSHDMWSNRHDYFEELLNFFLETENTEYALTVIDELSVELNRLPNHDAIGRMNERMRMAGIGYKHDGIELHRVEDEVFYEEVSKKCFGVLSKKNYSKTQKFLIQSYGELKLGQYDDALMDCCQALETTIKTRLKECKITYGENDNMSTLLGIVRKKIVVPSFSQNYFGNFAEIITGVSTARNKEGGHASSEGVRSKIKKDDDHFVRFIINQTVSNILFIVEADFN